MGCSSVNIFNKILNCIRNRPENGGDQEYEMLYKMGIRAKDIQDGRIDYVDGRFVWVITKKGAIS